MAALEQTLVGALRGRGYLYAKIDSLVREGTTSVYATQGPLVVVDEIDLVESRPGVAGDLSALIRVREGDPFVVSAVERDLLTLLAELSRAGYPFAEGRIAELSTAPGNPGRIRIVISVDAREAVLLDHIELPGAIRTRPGFVGRLAGVRPGRPLVDFDPGEIRSLLEGTRYFDEVGEPELQRLGDDRVAMIIPVRESAPGNFDLVMGYTPETSTVRRGGLVGNGHLELRNLFGGGRAFDIRLNRLPGRVSTVDVGVSDPMILGLPVGAEMSFHGVQQDSTYDQQKYGLNVTYGLTRSLAAVAGVSREVTGPGQAGLSIRAGEQRIPRSTATFLGAGVQFESLDWPVNPRSGLLLETMFERGSKNRTARRVDAEGDTLTERTRVRQERLRLEARYFVPVFRRQVVAVGLDARLLLSDEYDESDLLRFGGATSLRGYNEEQFLGRLAARLLVEVRHQLDRHAYAFVFTDLGYLEVPDTRDLSKRRDVLPGFGFGLQFRTPVGLINTTYAFNDSDSPLDGRVHVGLSFSL